MHGANAPLMRSMVSQQMELEKKVLAGEVRYIWVLTIKHSSNSGFSLRDL